MSVVIVVINLVAKCEVVVEWLGVIEGHLFLNPGLTSETSIHYSVVDRSKRSIGCHELHYIILFLHAKYFEVDSIQCTWEAISMANILGFEMCFDCATIDVPRPIPSVLDD